MELLQREIGALLLLEIVAELHDLELAERVVEIGGIGCAALGFDKGGLL